METFDIAQKYNISQRQFEEYLQEVGAGWVQSSWGTEVMHLADDEVPEHVQKFKERIAPILEAEAQRQKALAEAEAQRQKALAEAEEKKQLALSNMLITSGFNFDGYRIIKYSGYISGDDAILIEGAVDKGVWDGWEIKDMGQALTDSLVKIRRQALKELKEAAYDLGCNAVIGVDFDYITLEPTQLTANIKHHLPYVCVTANGNAVIIEKDDSK